MSNLRTCKVCGDLHMLRGLIEGRCHKCTHEQLKKLEATEMDIQILKKIVVGQKCVEILIWDFVCICPLSDDIYDALPKDFITRLKVKIQEGMNSALANAIASWIYDIHVETIQEECRTVKIINLLAKGSPYLYLRKRILANGDQILEGCMDDARKYWEEVH